MKKLIAGLVIGAITLLAAPGLAAPVSENCAVSFTVPSVFEITVVSQFSIELPKTGFTGEYVIDPSVQIINDGMVEIWLTADSLDLNGNNLYFLLGLSETVDSTGETAQINAGTLSAPLTVSITQSTALPGGFSEISTVTIGMTDL